MRKSFLSLGILFVSLMVVGRAQTPTMRATDPVVNGASFESGRAITPGSLISIFGSKLSTSLTLADSVPLSTALGGVSVRFTNGSTSIDAPMLHAIPESADGSSPSQLNLQVPWNIVPANTSATVNVIVTRNGVSSPVRQVNVAPFSPGIFSSSGRGIIANTNDYTFAWPAGLFPGLTTHPAVKGDVIIIYATGLGAVPDTPANGSPSLDKVREVITRPVVLIGGLSAKILFAGLAPEFPGVNQLNVEVPDAAPGNDVPVQIQVGGVTSPAVTMAVTR
jgi:uncharacterized protein (TIGR03437 family)